MRSNFTILLILFSTLTFGQGNGLYKFIGKNNKYGFMDKTGIVKVKPNYLVVNDFNDGLCFVSREVISKGYKWICIDTLGKEVFDIKDNSPETSFNEGYARISSFTEQWFIDKKGKKVFNKTWKDGYDNFRNGVAFVSDIQFYDFYPIDTNGKRIENAVYSRSEAYQKLNGKQLITDDKLTSYNTLIKFKQDSLWGFKNPKGEVVIKPRYYFADEFKNGLCAVRADYQRFFSINDYYFDTIINTKGEIINQLPMHCYLGFQGDLIVYYGGFHFSGGVFYLDKNGQKVIPKE